MSSATGKPHPGSPAPGSEERLNSWKKIAEYLRRSVRSAMRWEKVEGLPVHHRHIHGEGESVYAYREELNVWWINDASPEQASELASDGRLDSWKEIATHLRCSVRSVRRWEKEDGLPIHRHIHGKGDSIYAYRKELDDWWNTRGAWSAQGERLNDQNGKIRVNPGERET